MNTRILIASSCLVLAVATGGAIAKPIAMPQDVSAAMVQQAEGNSGVALIATGPGTFERFVRDASKCDIGEAAVPDFNANGAYLGLVCENTYSGRH